MYKTNKILCSDSIFGFTHKNNTTLPKHTNVDGFPEIIRSSCTTRMHIVYYDSHSIVTIIMQLLSAYYHLYYPVTTAILPCRYRHHAIKLTILAIVIITISLRFRFIQESRGRVLNGELYTQRF